MIGNYMMVTLVKLLGSSKDSLFALSVETKKSTKEILEDINSINSILLRNGYSEISIFENKYNVPKSLIENSEQIFKLFHHNQISFLPTDRTKIIFLYTYSKNTYLSNFHYQDILHVSRNTTLNDINELRDKISDYNIELAYTRGDGYHLVGREYDKHKYAFTVLSDLLKSPIGEWTVNYILNHLDEENKIPELLNKVHQFEIQYNIQNIQNRLLNIVYFLQFLLVRYKTENKLVDLNSKRFIDETTIVNVLVESLCGMILPDPNSLTKIELSFIELLLLGSFEKNLENKKIDFNELTDEIVEEMEKLSLIQFDNREQMIEGIKKHLVPAYYRIKLNFEDVNEYLNIVINQYPDLFEIVKKALNPLQKLVMRKIPDSEVAYFVIHFGGYIREYSYNVGEIKALIICPNGISSSLILKEQLSKLFPDITFLNTHRLDEVEKIDSKSYDIVFSTINIEINKPHFIVPISLNDQERKELYSLVYEEIPILRLKPSPVDEIIKVVGKHSTIMDENSLRLELTKIISNENKNKRKGDSPLLHELIREDTFQHSTKILDWKDAFYLASKPLLNKKDINKNYIEKMIQRVEEYGPFINLGKGIAIPHARPEDGVSELSMSMLVLDHSVYLPEDDRPINILIVIAAIDNETHLSALSYLTNVLRDDEKVEQLTNAKEYNDIVKIIYQGGEE